MESNLYPYLYPLIFSVYLYLFKSVIYDLSSIDAIPPKFEKAPNSSFGAFFILF